MQDKELQKEMYLSLKQTIRQLKNQEEYQVT